MTKNAKRPTLYDVFISYRRGYPAEARLLQSELVAHGHKTFLDVEDLGDCYFDERLEAVIKNCTNFVCVITPGSVERLSDKGDWVRRELEVALASGRHIVVVNMDKVLDWSSESLPKSLERLPAVNAVHFNHEHFSDFIKKLLSRLVDTTASKAQEEFKSLDTLAKNAEYKAWQVQTVKDRLNNEGPKGELAKVVVSFPVIAGEQYALLMFRAAGAEHPFMHRRIESQLTERDVNELPDFASSECIPAWVNNGRSGPLRQHYYEMLGTSKRVRRWNMRGFALKKLRLDAAGAVFGIDAELCTYGENCLSSHFLGYQMLKDYEGGQFDGDWNRTAPHLLWTEFAGDGSNQTEFSLSSDEPLLPLISVQALTLFRDPYEDDEWSMIAMVREENVAAAAGFWQFPPSGGFEIYGREDEQSEHLLSQFDLRKAILREFLEEIYGDADMACESVDDASGHQDGSVGYQQAMQSIKAKLLNVHLMGVVTELIGFRSEFSFAIFVDDPKLIELNYTVHLENGVVRQAKWLKGSHEGKRLMKVPVRDIGKFALKKVWNPSSIGMLKLLADTLIQPNNWIQKKYPDFPAFVL